MPAVKPNRYDALYLPLLGLFAAFPFRKILGGGETLFHRSVFAYFEPQARFIREALLSGTFPIWNPYVLSGVPFAANPSSMVFYPPALLFLLPPPWGMNFFIALHYLWAAGGMYLLLRSWGRSPEAGLLSGAAFSAGGYLLSQTASPLFLIGASWLPWVILAYERALAGRPAGRALAALALTMQLFAGDGLTACLSWGLVILWNWSIPRRAERETPPGESPRPPWRRGLGALFGVGLPTFVLFALLAAPLLFPAAELAGLSARGLAGEGGGTAWSLGPWRLAELLLPGVFGYFHPENTYWGGLLDPAVRAAGPFSVSLFLGLVPLTAALCAFLPRGAGGGRRRWLLLGAGLFGLLAAFGGRTPFLSFAGRLVPLLSFFRYPERYFLLCHFAIAALAGIGLDRALPLAAGLFDKERAGEARGALFYRRLALGLAALLVLALGLLLLLREKLPDVLADLGGGEGRAYATLSYSLVFSAAVALCLLAVLSLHRQGIVSRRPVRLLLPALAALELLAAGSALVWTTDSSFFTRPPELKRVLDRLEPPGAAPSRVAWALGGYTLPPAPAGGTPPLLREAETLRNLMAGNVGAGWGVYLFDGGSTVLLETTSRFLGLVREDRRLLGAADVKYLVTPLAAEPPAGEPFETAYEDPALGCRLLLDREAAPRAWRVGSWREEGNPEAAARLLSSSGFDWLEEAVLDPATGAAPAPAGPGAAETGEGAAAGKTLIKLLGINRVEVETEGPAAGLLVLADAWHPGWSAEVNGREAPVLLANLAYRAVPVPAGKSRVVFEYAPPLFYAGLLLSLLTLAGLLLYHRAGWRRA